MTIKGIIDAARSSPEYAGLAIFSGELPVFTEHLGLEYATRLLSLSRRACLRSGGNTMDVCATAGGFTLYVWGESGFTIVFRASGRFSPWPSIRWAEPDYLDPATEALLPSRAEVRREAEALLRQYDLLS